MEGNGNKSSQVYFPASGKKERELDKMLRGRTEGILGRWFGIRSVWKRGMKVESRPFQQAGFCIYVSMSVCVRACVSLHVRVLVCISVVCVVAAQLRL